MPAPSHRRSDQTRRTRDALLRAALRVVARHGFAGASVQRITAACGIAQGSLYTHFGSHRELLEELLPHEGIRLLRALGRSVDHAAGHFENERRTFEALFDYLRRKPYFLRLLTEAEIAAPRGYRQHARNIEDRYLRALHRARTAGEVRPLPDEDYRVIAGVLSSSRGYIGIGLSERDPRRLFHPAPMAPWITQAYLRFVRHGLGCEEASTPPVRDAPDEPDMAPADEPRSGTRDEILDAAARRIHRDGYVGTTVAGICAEAGVAVGTFYGHFPSRREMFDALIERTRDRMQAEVLVASAGSRSPCELEQRSFDAFFRHLLRNPWFTRIETEAAVRAPESYLRHFQELATGIVEALRGFHAAGQLQHFEERDLPVVAWMLMTARHHFATRFVLVGDVARPLSSQVRDAWLSFAAQGLANDHPGAAPGRENLPYRDQTSAAPS
jgi:AcrR family transcriptional regulator